VPLGASADRFAGGAASLDASRRRFVPAVASSFCSSIMLEN